MIQDDKLVAVAEQVCLLSETQRTENSYHKTGNSSTWFVYCYQGFRVGKGHCLLLETFQSYLINYA